MAAAASKTNDTAKGDKWELRTNDIASAVSDLESSTIAHDGEFRTCAKHCRSASELLDWFREQSGAEMVKDVDWICAHPESAPPILGWNDAKRYANAFILKRVKESIRRIRTNKGAYFFFKTTCCSVDMPTDTQMDAFNAECGAGSKLRKAIERVVGRKVITYPMITIAPIGPSEAPVFHLYNLGIWLAVCC